MATNLKQPRKGVCLLIINNTVESYDKLKHQRKSPAVKAAIGNKLMIKLEK